MLVCYESQFHYCVCNVFNVGLSLCCFRWVLPAAARVTSTVGNYYYFYVECMKRVSLVGCVGEMEDYWFLQIMLLKRFHKGAVFCQLIRRLLLIPPIDTTKQKSPFGYTELACFLTQIGGIRNFPDHPKPTTLILNWSTTNIQKSLSSLSTDDLKGMT